MSANNKRIRRIIVDLLFEFGPSTKERMAELLNQKKSVRSIPSPHTLSALLSKNPQIVAVGSEEVENVVGIKAKHLIYDINRKLIKTKDDITYTRTPTIMTPAQKKLSQKCSCGRHRVFPEGHDKCLICIRSECL
tara:strand:+ start:343 stop:747 length:405 start_codon:yes stop_codon:yes gene_type:complete